MKKVVISDSRLLESYIVPSYHAFLKHLVSDSAKALFADRGWSVVDLEDVERGDGAIFITVGAAGVDQARSRGLKVVSIWDDVHYLNEETRASRHSFFKKVDMLLLHYHRNFVRMNEYREYWEKSRVFPWFAVDDLSLSKDFCFDAKHPRALFTGRVSDSYLLRKKIVSAIESGAMKSVDLLKHPGYNENQDRENGRLGGRYYDFIGSYQVSVATSLSMRFSEVRCDYTLAKYFEIPSVNTVLVCEDTGDLEALGFVHGKNYIRFDESMLEGDLMEKLRDFDLKEIARAGRELIASRHSLLPRQQLLIERLNGLTCYQGDRSTPGAR